MAEQQVGASTRLFPSFIGSYHIFFRELAPDLLQALCILENIGHLLMSKTAAMDLGVIYFNSTETFPLFLQDTLGPRLPDLFHTPCHISLHYKQNRNAHTTRGCAMYSAMVRLSDGCMRYSPMYCHNAGVVLRTLTIVRSVSAEVSPKAYPELKNRPGFPGITGACGLYSRTRHMKRLIPCTLDLARGPSLACSHHTVGVSIPA